jgi:hypothetical protein
MAEADELAKLAPDVIVTQRGIGQDREFVLWRWVAPKVYGYSSSPQELGDIVSMMMRTVTNDPPGPGASGAQAVRRQV